MWNSRRVLRCCPNKLGQLVCRIGPILKISSEVIQLRTANSSQTWVINIILRILNVICGEVILSFSNQQGRWNCPEFTLWFPGLSVTLAWNDELLQHFEAVENWCFRPEDRGQFWESSGGRAANEKTAKVAPFHGKPRNFESEMVVFQTLGKTFRRHFRYQKAL